MSRIPHHADLLFTGWGKCSANTVGQVTVKYTKGDTTTSHNDWYGYNPTGPRVVDFHDDAVVYNPTWAETRGLHEFMHTLGFEHEWETSANTGNDCNLSSNGLTGDRYGTPYDHGSLTNATYCPNMDTMHDPSPWDVIGLQRAYGRKPTGSLVSYNNKCLQMASDGTAASPIKTYDCSGFVAQSWKYTASNEIATKSAFAYGNMDAKNGVAAAHTPIVNWAANGTAAQKWYLENIQIVGLGAFCLSVKGGDESLAVEFVAGKAAPGGAGQGKRALHGSVQRPRSPIWCAAWTRCRGWREFVR